MPERSTRAAAGAGEVVRGSWPAQRKKQFHDRRPYFGVVSNPGMTSLIESDEFRTGNLAGDVLRARIGTVPVVASTDDQRGCADRVQRYRRQMLASGCVGT